MLSFVVPTLAARRADLERCLAALARETAGMDAEVIPVVEDAAAAAGLDRFATSSLAIRPVIQGGGASKRRNAAFIALRGDVVALVDDDAEPLPGYGAALAARFADGRARIVQGAVWPAFDVEPPESIRPVLFSVGGFNCHGDARRRDVFISANAAFSRAVLDAAGPMREDFGPGGAGVPWGDDTEWAARARAAGFVPEFDEQIAVRHRIQAERLTERYVLDRADRVGRTRARLEWQSQRPGALTVLHQRALAMWARTKGASIESECRRRRLAGYADELARIRGQG